MGLAIAGALVLLIGSSPASAGGSPWEFDQPSYLPGETVFGWAQVAWEHNPDLGAPEDGPYYASLVPARWADLPVTAPIRVAEIDISLEPYDAGGVEYGPHHVTVRFEMPAIPPGEYQLIHCNDPCTTTFADLFPTPVMVGSPPASTPPTPTTTPPAPTTTTTVATTVPDAPASTSTSTLAAGLGVGAAVAGGVLFLTRRREART